MSDGTIDINCDLGERDDPAAIAADRELLRIVSSANIACGGHAGDVHSMTRTVAAAIESGAAIGAHPGYPDRQSFGRVAHELAGPRVEEAIAVQVEALLQVVRLRGGALNHVKPHGALYHAAMTRAEVAQAVGRGVARLQVPLILVGQAGAPALQAWRDMGFSVAAEAFADRRYEADGSLRPRHHADALLDDPAAAAAQALGIARGAGVLTPVGTFVDVHADTLCVHSDTPGAVAIARAVRTALVQAGFQILPLRR